MLSFSADHKGELHFPVHLLETNKKKKRPKRKKYQGLVSDASQLPEEEREPSSGPKLTAWSQFYMECKRSAFIQEVYH